MMAANEAIDIQIPYEEELGDYTIFIEDNPDHWTGGYLWSACKNGIEFDSGLEFSIAGALQVATANIIGS
ncbi:hypothetical protein Q3O60_07440 [Alkalimonas collagenimarina]|uniref:Uncharacterized protein n=1 Tax=Alkalimonas collagenimarina TaxID=400390 RepID=A0ABT9GY78_9GAMM|nr:hypothetical protein [Alkalimonas collagenimarina]MDP4536014.1 hypothetical protein [Alkalimonas collagenimarina]